MILRIRSENTILFANALGILYTRILSRKVILYNKNDDNQFINKTIAMKKPLLRSFSSIKHCLL